MSWKMMRPVMLALGVSSVVLASGCAQEREPINRVQANALDKAFFVGADLVSQEDNPEFLTQATLVDVGYGAAQDGVFTSTYTQGVARIKWQITEDLLLGRLAYERIATSDGKGVGAKANEGQVVVAYAIQSHFDIRRSYNPSTGEELNVIEENTTDRPWYERQYFRVDWSKNLNTDAYDFDTLSLMGIYGGVTYEPLAYYVNDPADKDAPYFDVDTGYFDVTNKAYAAPAQIDLSRFGWGIDKFPACFLDNDFLGGSAPHGNCNPVELTIRQAFRKVVDTDYEPAHWDGYRFQSYGAFYTERYGYARNYGMSDEMWHRFINRYNIWERSHYYDNPEAMEGPVECYTPETYHHGDDPHADVDNDGTEDACTAVTVKLGRAKGLCKSDDDDPTCYGKAQPVYGGSRCDTFKQRCTLPYRERKVRPLAWYYTEESNLDYFDPTEWATHDHDVAMRRAIMIARYAECMATAKNREFCLVGDENFPGNPVYFGQMDDHLEAQQLAKEVDDCRHGLSYVGENGQENYGPLNSSAREQKCVALAVAIADVRTDGGARYLDPGVIALAQMPEQVVLCHSPVEANDPAICAPADQRLPAGVTAHDCANARENGDADLLATCRAARNVRRGDLRYHQINVLEAPQTPSPWGIYTDSHDPLSGETFSASVNVWSHVNDLWSQGTMDRVRYVKGELDTADVTEADFVRDWSRAAEAANGGGVAPRLTKAEADRHVADFARVEVDALQQFTKSFDPVAYDKALKLRSELQHVKAAVDAPSTMAPIYEARRKAAQGTAFEAELVNRQMQELTGTTDLPADIATDRASILRSINPTVQKQLRNFYQHSLAQRGTCIFNEAPAPMSLTGLADQLEAKFATACAEYDESGSCTRHWGKFGQANGAICSEPGNPDSCSDAKDPAPAFAEKRAEAMRRYLADRAHYAVIVHEMGHSIGERHNFISSSDAYNFRPQYWQLRTNDGQNTTLCGDFDPTGSCVGPRYYDPVTQHESDQVIWMWMHSSVMDYAGEYTQDMLGLGAYDFAAHAMFYGENVAVFEDPSYALGQPRASGMLLKIDNFGGILGIQPTFAGQDIHYSALQRNYELIKDCAPVNPETYKPASWDESKYGVWSPLLDGLIVRNENGQYTKCKQQRVDFKPWRTLRFPSTSELPPNSFYRGGPSLDESNRVRVPYGFATDRWADLGNASVYRHDNGADVYEIFDFLASQQEVHHIFDNYRRGRQSFSVKSSAGRTLSRYNEKIRDGAKGMTLLYNIYRDFSLANGWVFDGGYWPLLIELFFRDNVLASSMVFDHFVRTASRPQAGPHFRHRGILRSEEDTYVNSAAVEVIVPNGATGYFGNVSVGGKIIENRLCDSCGEYDAEFTVNAGSYYDKIYAPYLFTESVDNFISDSRGDFVDGRYRAVSLADLFPEGFRRWLGNALTNDEELKGMRLAGSANGAVLVENECSSDPNKPTCFPSEPLGWIKWWGQDPSVCFPNAGTTICETYDGTGNFNPLLPPAAIPMDSQMGWEVQKFLIAQTLLYLPSNQKEHWINQLRLWQLGADPDPEFDNRIEFHDPLGKIYVAKSYGRETYLGRTVQAGIAARVLEYANDLLSKAYEVTPIDNDGDSVTDWYEWVPGPDGQPVVAYDPSMQFVDANGNFVSSIPGCSPTQTGACPCSANTACRELEDYVSVPFYLRQALAAYGLDDPEKKGVWE